MITTEQAAKLKPGDKLTMSGMSGRWADYNGKEIVVVDVIHASNTIEMEPIYIDFIDMNVHQCGFEYLDFPASGGKHKCNCPRDVWMYQGCKCGGL